MWTVFPSMRPPSTGATHLLERMAFKSTKNWSHLLIVREVEAIGGHVMASANWEQMVYTFDGIKTYVPEMVELLIDFGRNPVFLDWKVNEELKKLKTELAEFDPEFVCKVVDIAVGEILTIAAPDQVDWVELNRAKEYVKSGFLMNLESREAYGAFLECCG